MKLGFTGTRYGMSSRQKNDLRTYLLENKITEFHHGDCIGADEQAHEIAVVLGIRIVIHPPINPRQRAFCHRKEINRLISVLVLPEKEYSDRNKSIVDMTNILIAAPFTDLEQLRSGTWATVRYATYKKREKKILRR